MSDEDYDRLDVLLDSDPITLLHEHREALSEIARHHEAITDLRAYLQWSLDFIGQRHDHLGPRDAPFYGRARELLNRTIA